MKALRKLALVVVAVALLAAAKCGSVRGSCSRSPDGTVTCTVEHQHGQEAK